MGLPKTANIIRKKMDAQRLESENKLEEYKSRIESIRDASKIERERTIAEKINIDLFINTN